MFKCQRYISNKSLVKDEAISDAEALRIIEESPEKNGLGNEIVCNDMGKYEIKLWRKMQKDETILKFEKVFH